MIPLENLVGCNEEIVERRKVKIISVAVMAASVPLYSLTIYYTIIKSIIRLLNYLSFLSLEASNVISIIFVCIIVILLLIWGGVCYYLTRSFIKNELLMTKENIYFRNGEEQEISPISEVKDVYVEQSLWGKLFNYGNVVINCRRSVIKVKNIGQPKELKQSIYNLTQLENRTYYI